MSLDREIEDLLAVDPSPEFVAKVRRQIAGEPEPAASWIRWRVAAVGAVAAAVTMAMWLWPVSPRDVSPMSAPAAARVAAATPRAIANRREAGVPAAAASIETAPAVVAANHRRVPAVLISRDDAEGFEALLKSVDENALPDMATALAVMDSTGPEWIAIAPVEIDPIGGAEGE